MAHYDTTGQYSCKWTGQGAQGCYAKCFHSTYGSDFADWYQYTENGTCSDTAECAETFDWLEIFCDEVGNHDCCGVPDGDGTSCPDCLGVHCGSAVVDECGVCDGGGIPDGECDCDGNVSCTNHTDCSGWNGMCDVNGEVGMAGCCVHTIGGGTGGHGICPEWMSKADCKRRWQEEDGPPVRGSLLGSKKPSNR